MKKLSIIIPVYNVEQYLDKCLSSVCNQTLKDLEIICVNDGSKDNSGEILEKWAQKDKRIQIITQENAGLSAARNTGIPYATGEYITFLDSDDWVSFDFYETLYNEAKKNDADIALGNVIYYYNDFKQIFELVSNYSFKKRQFVLESPEEKKYVMQSCAVWNKIYRREFIINNNLSFYSGKNVEDFPFTFVATALANKIVCCPMVYLYYRQRETSIMKDPSQQNKNVYDVFDNFKRLYQECVNLGINKISVYNDIYLKMALSNMLMWAEKLNDKKARKRYIKDVIDFVNQFDCNDIDNMTIMNRIIYNNIKNKFLNRICKMNINYHKVEYWFMGLPVFKIKILDDKIQWLLLCFLSVHEIELPKEV